MHRAGCLAFVQPFYRFAPLPSRIDRPPPATEPFHRRRLRIAAFLSGGKEANSVGITGRLPLTQQFREQASLALDLAQARYKLGLGSIVEYSQANLQKTEADLQDTDAHYQYHVSQLVLAYTIGLPR